MNVKAIVIKGKHRIVFYECDGKCYIVSEHWKKKHWVEDFCSEVLRSDGNKIYKAFIKDGFEKCSKEVCDRYIR